MNIGELSSTGLKKWLHLVIYFFIPQTMIEGLGIQKCIRYMTGSSQSCRGDTKDKFIEVF